MHKYTQGAPLIRGLRVSVRTFICPHTLSHANILTHTCMWAGSPTDQRSRVCVQILLHTNTHTSEHTLSLTQTHIHACTVVVPLIRGPECAWKYVCTLTHTSVPHTRLHIHTHTYTYMYIRSAIIRGPRCVCKYTCIHTHIHLYTQTLSLIRTYACA